MQYIVQYIKKESICTYTVHTKYCTVCSTQRIALSRLVDKQNQLIVAIVLLHQERKQQRKNNYASFFHNISSSVVSSLVVTSIFVYLT